MSIHIFSEKNDDYLSFQTFRFTQYKRTRYFPKLLCCCKLLESVKLYGGLITDDWLHGQAHSLSTRNGEMKEETSGKGELNTSDIEKLRSL